MKRKKVESLIQEYAVWWTKVLGLGHWDLSFKCADGTIEPASGDTVAGEATVSWKYENAVITFYPDVLKEMTEDDVSNIKKFMGIPYISIKKANTVSIADIKKISGIQ